MITVAVAGTFNVIHKGHLALLEKAFEAGDVVHIGLTSDEMAGKARNVPVQSYEIREKQLLEAVMKISGNKSFDVLEINDAFGPTATGNYDVIVVSKNTREIAEALNWARKKSGLKKIKIIEIDIVMAEDHIPITSTRIMKGEIDKNGIVRE